MKTYATAIKSLLAIGLLVVSSSGFAIPTLNYFGGMTYTTNILSPADLNISGYLTPGFSSGLSVAPDLATSSVILSADFDSVTSTATTTTGAFKTTPWNDLNISDGVNGLLLSGNLSSLTLTGGNGMNLGLLVGAFQINGGVLAGDFGGVGNLFSISFNLDTVFSSTMFDSDFVGFSNGSVSQGISQSVPEPMPLALLSIGLFGMTLVRRIYKSGSIK